MKQESFEEFINHVSDEQHRDIDNYDEFMTNLRRGSECKEMSNAETIDEVEQLRRESEKEMKSATRWAIVAVVLNAIAFGLQIFRFIMRVTGAWE